MALVFLASCCQDASDKVAADGGISAHCCGKDSGICVQEIPLFFFPLAFLKINFERKTVSGNILGRTHDLSYSESRNVTKRSGIYPERLEIDTKVRFRLGKSRDWRHMM